MDILFLVQFILFPVVFFYLARGFDVDFLKVGIFPFFLTCFFFFSYVGLLPLYLGWDEYRVELGVVDKKLIVNIYIFSVSVLLVMFSGYFTFSRLFPLKDRVQVEMNQLDSIQTLRLTVLLSVVLVVLVKYISQVPSIALIDALMNTGSNLTLSRSLMTNGFSGYTWYSLFIHDLLIFLSLIFFVQFLLSKTFLSCLCFIASFSLASFTLLMTTEKAPFAWYLISLFICYCAVRYSGRYPVRKLVFLFLLILLMLAGTYAVFMNSTDLWKGISSVFSRAFAGSIQPAYHYLEFFPEHQDYLLGRSFPNPGGLLPFEPYSLTQEVMKWVNPADFEKGIIGTMPTVYWGELYANFGYFGILIVPFFIGGYFVILEKVAGAVSSMPVKIALRVWLMLHLKDLTITGISNYIFDFSLALILLSTLFLAKFGRVKRAGSLSNCKV